MHKVCSHLSCSLYQSFALKINFRFRFGRDRTDISLKASDSFCVERVFDKFQNKIMKMCFMYNIEKFAFKKTKAISPPHLKKKRNEKRVHPLYYTTTIKDTLRIYGQSLDKGRQASC